jgi:hypothetical protein
MKSEASVGGGEFVYNFSGKNFNTSILSIKTLESIESIESIESH